MKKSTILLLTVAILVAGCSSSRSNLDNTPLGEGKYRVDVPHVTDVTGTNSNPTIQIHECGRIDITFDSFQGNRSGHVSLNWIDGLVTTYTETNIVEQSTGE